MGELSSWHLAIGAVVVLMLVGTKRLPDAAQFLGRSVRISKIEVQALRGDKPSSEAGSTRPFPLPASAPASRTRTEQTRAERSTTG